MIVLGLAKKTYRRKAVFTGRLPLFDIERGINGHSAEERLRARREARSRRDFRAADAIRDELASRGVSIADGGDGTSWKKTS